MEKCIYRIQCSQEHGILYSLQYLFHFLYTFYSYSLRNVLVWMKFVYAIFQGFEFYLFLKMAQIDHLQLIGAKKQLKIKQNELALLNCSMFILLKDEYYIIVATLESDEQFKQFQRTPYSMCKWAPFIVLIRKLQSQKRERKLQERSMSVKTDCGYPLSNTHSLILLC